MRALSLILAMIVCGAEPPIPRPEQADTVYYLVPGGGKILPLERQTPTPRASRSFAAIDMQGVTSPFRVSVTQPTFVIRRATPPDKKIDRLMSLESVNGKRTLLLAVGADKFGSPLPGKSFDLELRTGGPNTYAFRPVRPLAPGEYVINFGATSVAFLFGVDAGASSPEPEPPSTAAANAAADPTTDKKRILDSLLQKKLISDADYRAKLAELAAPPSPPGPEERLRRLDDLLKKGLISKPDYQKKRAEILAEI